ncbi:MAG: dTMP kinase [Xanthobacteraceae bacterium]|uniref:dTMP kinase n=1 Tax=Pseudolabrys sp. TaxID=1960880 RepID=UPI003D0F9B3A
MTRGRFITFEGGEGSGKSTHATLLAQQLKQQGIDVIQTREPGGSPGAEIMRHIILSGAAKHLGGDAELLLFAAARDDHIRNTIAPALAAGQWVICDRFMDSTRIYQGIAGKTNPRLTRALERIVVGEYVPDLTFIMDLPADTGLARAQRRRGNSQADRFEAEAPEFHEMLREAFRILAKQDSDRCVLIDAGKPKPAVFDQIWTAVRSRLGVGGVARVVEGAAS